MKHNTYETEHANPVPYDRITNIERYLSEARRHRDAYIAELVGRGVRWLASWFDNSIVKPLRNGRDNVTAEVRSSSLETVVIKDLGQRSQEPERL
jgi:hypothetical protein